VKQNDVTRDVKTRYMLWPGIKYSMYSCQSKSDSIIFIPRRVKAGLHIYFTISFNGNETPGETKRCYSRCQTCYMLWPGIKYSMYSLQTKTD
jgi:hypothetical protein